MNQVRFGQQQNQNCMIQKMNRKEKTNDQTIKSQKQQQLKLPSNNNQSQKIEVNVAKKQNEDAYENKQKQALRKLKSAQQFFNKKYLGNKNSSKSVNRMRSLKVLPLRVQNAEQIYQIKSNNLNTKIHQIQSIFKTQKKKNHKKVPKILQNFTDFQMYITKRDILKQKNQNLQKLRKIKTQTKVIINQNIKQTVPQNLNLYSKQKAKQQSQINRNYNQNKPLEQHVIQNQNVQQKNQNYAQKQQIPKLPKKQTYQQIKSPQQIDDRYFQKMFQQKILKNKFKAQNTFSINSLLDPSSKKYTTTNLQQNFKKQLDIIQQVAQKTVFSFRMKQKVDGDLYNSNQQQDYQSVIRGAMNSPTDFNNIRCLKPDQKSISWILKACDQARKKFNVRKSKSLKIIKKSQ